MRTRVSIDSELLAAAKVRAARTNQSIGSLLDEAVRRMLSEPGAAGGAPSLPDVAYRGSLREGVDLYDKAATAELLGASGR